MSIISSYKDPIIPDWNRDENGDKVSELITNEQKQVVGNRITLDYLPDIQYRVFINENFIEIDIREEVTQSNQFKVNYEAGYITVHESLDGEFITIKKYYGRGVIFYPSSRVHTKVATDGTVIETLKDFEVKVQGAVDITGDIKGTINLANQTKQDLDESVVIGNQTINNLDDLVAQTDFATIDNKIGVLTEKVSPETPLTTTSQNLSGGVSEVKDELVAHKLDYMPHRIQDLKNKKNYNFGFQVSAEGNPQIIYEEVI